MSAVSVDFNKLLGYKLIVRANRALQMRANDSAACEQASESGELQSFTPILQAKIGQKGAIGLRLRSA